MIIAIHMLAGSVIALSINQPAAAISLAFASHFAMDALPQFGYPGNKGYGEALKHRLSFVVALVTVLCLLIISAFLIAKHQWLALAAGVVAILPDFLGFYNYLAYEKRAKSPDKLTWLLHVRFHRRIQIYERPWGIWIELIFILLLTSVLIVLV